MKKIISFVLSLAMVLSLTACKKGNDSTNLTSTRLAFDDTAWNYDAENDVYWQIGVLYCEDPKATEYESLGIYVPGTYMTGVENEFGTYTCEPNIDGNISGYTSETAPIVMPINAAGYSTQVAPTSYSYEGLSSYLEAGFIYVYAGCRGRDNGYDSDSKLAYSGGAPWGVTDLKAAVRYLRYNDNVLPGDMNSIFTMGHSGGGAQSALMGATGDSELYYEYLNSIGAIMYDDNGYNISDAIAGAMCWCPITSFDYANEAYEWMMGQYFTTDTRANDTWTSVLSYDLATAFAVYINELGIKDEEGNVLTLIESDNGIYTSGTYYEYLLSEIEHSLNNFLTDTKFPYTFSGISVMSDGGFAGGDNSGGGSRIIGEGTNVTYETKQDYINSLNADIEWVIYDEITNMAKITNIGNFVTHCKSNNLKDVGAFDDLNRLQDENALFGDDKNNELHFDSIMASILLEKQDDYSLYSDWGESYVEDYQEYKDSVDSLGNDSLYRQRMYNPMYYLSDYYEGSNTSTVAPYWRIRTGINQAGTSTTVEMNLALALQQLNDVEFVDFETVWEQSHTKAERTGDSTENFILWVNECLN